MKDEVHRATNILLSITRGYTGYYHPLEIDDGAALATNPSILY